MHTISLKIVLGIHFDFRFIYLTLILMGILKSKKKNVFSRDSTINRVRVIVNDSLELLTEW